ncbi:MAG: hypothetical protein J5685_05045 [Clostridiales bacterium]|nr:hypothetical protein [Clostridiales bacterium]
MWIIWFLLWIIVSVMLVIGFGLFISAGRLLKSNDFGNWKSGFYDLVSTDISYECYEDNVPKSTIDDFIMGYGDTKNWK